ncbi:hypothetical protein A4X13_0g5824 [Tilletia indica]|uniref:Uncharacterized protein n=1 Tax=Tilletia indica TaxID=43049 RepID=A0A177T9R8_9BASI|nr:hypothetical protein A4X13_0g5824 [Tilletia indica]
MTDADSLATQPETGQVRRTRNALQQALRDYYRACEEEGAQPCFLATLEDGLPGFYSALKEEVRKKMDDWRRSSARQEQGTARAAAAATAAVGAAATSADRTDLLAATPRVTTEGQAAATAAPAVVVTSTSAVSAGKSASATPISAAVTKNPTPIARTTAALSPQTPTPLARIPGSSKTLSSTSNPGSSKGSAVRTTSSASPARRERRASRSPEAVTKQQQQQQQKQTTPARSDSGAGPRAKKPAVVKHTPNKAPTAAAVAAAAAAVTKKVGSAGPARTRTVLSEGPRSTKGLSNPSWVVVSHDLCKQAMQERYRDQRIELLEKALQTIQRHRPGSDSTTLPAGIWALHDAALGVIAALRARAETVPTGWANVLAVPTQEQRAKLCDDRPASLEGYQCRLCGRLNPSSSSNSTASWRYEKQTTDGTVMYPPCCHKCQYEWKSLFRGAEEDHQTAKAKWNRLRAKLGPKPPDQTNAPLLWNGSPLLERGQDTETPVKERQQQQQQQQQKTSIRGAPITPPAVIGSRASAGSSGTKRKVRSLQPVSEPGSARVVAGTPSSSDDEAPLTSPLKKKPRTTAAVQNTEDPEEEEEEEGSENGSQVGDEGITDEGEVEGVVVVG